MPLLLKAVKHQIVAMFMLAAATALGCILFALLACRQLFNAPQQLEERRFILRKKTSF